MCISRSLSFLSLLLHLSRPHALTCEKSVPALEMEELNRHAALSQEGKGERSSRPESRRSRSLLLLLWNAQRLEPGQLRRSM